MRYTELLQLADAVTGLAYNVYNANGIWDPNFSATGHQPMGYDQWSTLYKTYRVKSARLKLSAQIIRVQYHVYLLLLRVRLLLCWRMLASNLVLYPVLVSQDTSGPNIRKLGPVTMDMSKFDGDIGRNIWKIWKLSLEQIQRTRSVFM